MKINYFLIFLIFFSLLHCRKDEADDRESLHVNAPKHSDAFSQRGTTLKLERSSCGCPGGCGHIEVKIEFIEKNKAKITETIDADVPIIRIFDADYSIDGKNYVFKNLSVQKDNNEQYFQIITDFTLDYKEELNGYLPKESNYFEQTLHAASSKDYILKRDKCAFVEKKQDECGTSSWVGYFCKK